MKNSSAPSSLSSRLVVITGGNTGLGYACVRRLIDGAAAAGAAPWHVVIACRDPGRAQHAVERLRREAKASGSAARVDAMPLDLASLQSVRGFAGELRRRLDAGELPLLHALACRARVR